MEKNRAEIEIPRNASDQIFRLLLDDITKAIRAARALRKGRIKITIEQDR